ncbi:hypothetical protein BDW62DRAFT_214405 [Aspergillus aurantiobrunneus]
MRWDGRNMISYRLCPCQIRLRSRVLLPPYYPTPTNRVSHCYRTSHLSLRYGAPNEEGQTSPHAAGGRPEGNRYLALSYALWKNICRFLDAKLQRLGVHDSAFPLQIPQSTRTADNVASAQAPYFSRWITSHRDLPLRLNHQYLVQEAYSAHLTQHSAREARDQTFRVPVAKWHRSTSADEPETSILLGYLPTLNRWIEVGTCRELGQTLSRKYDIAVPAPPVRSVEETSGDADADPIYVWQNTYTLTTRSIGLMVLTHADNRGLVLIIPVELGLPADDRQILHAEIGAIWAMLVQQGIRAVADLREWRSHAWKWHEGLVRGVPVSVSLGLEGVRDRVATVYRRDREKGEDGTRVIVRVEDLETEVPRLLGEIRDELFRRSWDDFVRGFPGKHGFGGCLAPHCLDEVVLKCLCVPWDQPEGIEGRRCIKPNCGNAARKWDMFSCK